MGEREKGRKGEGEKGCMTFLMKARFKLMNHEINLLKYATFVCILPSFNQ
jgi:hypothetical protein